MAALLTAELNAVSEKPSPASPASPTTPIRGDAGDGGDDVSEKNSGSEPDGRPILVERPAWILSVGPDSRHPIIPSEVRTKIEAIEVDARAKGWPAELLWSAGSWDSPRGLAAVLDAEDEITDVQADYIAILRVKRDVVRFRRHAG
ncbi:hypothetical protein [Candidatus Binatus sp.]|uniref:hypothetical protein n=1 Tax=Candidatus Binatus sp. TaxID=2811406 RepID=UPI003BAE822E